MPAAGRHPYSVPTSFLSQHASAWRSMAHWATNICDLHVLQPNQMLTLLTNHHPDNQNKTRWRATPKIFQFILERVCHHKPKRGKHLPHLPSLKVTVCTWKWMVGRLLSFWGPPILRAFAVVLGRVLDSSHIPTLPLPSGVLSADLRNETGEPSLFSWGKTEELTCGI